VLNHNIQAVPAPGAMAPDFTLPSTAGTDVTLAAFRGKQAVLIAFFPLAFTSTCTKELCAFTDDFDQFDSKGVAILPISVDSTATLKEFKAKLGMHTDMLSDFRRDVSSLYGVLMMDRYYSNRAYFLVDKSGILRWVHVETNPSNRRENSEILAEIVKLG
jgi:peroxiredoxin